CFPKRMKPYLCLETGYSMLDTGYLGEGTVYESRFAVLSLRLANDPVDPVGIRVKGIEAEVKTSHQENDCTGTDTQRQPQHIDQGIQFTIADMTPGDAKMMKQHRQIDLQDYSVLKLFMGLASAAATAWKLMVIRAMSKATAPATTKISQLRGM